MAKSEGDISNWLAASPPHSREAWGGDGCHEVLVHAHYAVLKGSQEGLRHPKSKMSAWYRAAKTQNDMDAAHELVEALWNQHAYDMIVERVIRSGARPIIISPHPSFDDDDCVDQDAGERHGPRNAIPFAFASRLKTMLNGFEDAPQILQGARVGRTKLPRFPRFLYQPHFVGDVLTDRPYIIADDTVSLGGTIAALYSHIVRHGGTVLAVSALSHISGKNVPLALTDGTTSGLKERFGAELDATWKETVGHGLDCLTEGEGRFILEWEAGDRGDPDHMLQRLRARIDRARATFQ